jgi:hypothetical protein
MLEESLGKEDVSKIPDMETVSAEALDASAWVFAPVFVFLFVFRRRFFPSVCRLRFLIPFEARLFEMDFFHDRA